MREHGPLDVGDRSLRFHRLLRIPRRPIIVCMPVSFIQTYQPLIAAGIAILAACIGFAGVVYSQNRIAKNAKADREHRVQLAELEEKQRRLAALGRAEQKRKEEIQSLLHALTGELSALHKQALAVYSTYQFLKVLYEQLKSTMPEHGCTPWAWRGFQTPVYDASVARIGLLPPMLAQKIAEVYSALKTGTPSAGPIENVTPSMALIMVQAMDISLNSTVSQVRDLVERLHAVRLGHNDPGDGKGTEYFNQHIATESQPNEQAATPPQDKV